MDFSVFEVTPGINAVINADAPLFTCIAVSNDFVKVAGVKREDVVGRPHFEVFTASPDDPNFTGEVNLRASFAYVIANKAPHQIPLQRYDIPNGDGTFQHKYWKVTNAPFFDGSNEVKYIIHTAIDITEQVTAQQQAETFKDFEKAYRFFMNVPILVGFISNDNYLIELANDELLEVWKKQPEVIGKHLFEAIPELIEKGIKDVLDNVFETGEPFHAFENFITLQRHGETQEHYFDLIYKPYNNDEGRKPSGVIIVGLDVTERVTAQKKVAQSEEKYKALFNTMDQGFCVLDMIFDEHKNPIDYKFIETNPLFEKQTGLLNAEGKTAREMVPDLEAHWFELYGKVAVTGEPIRFTQGSEAMGRWFEVSAFPIQYEETQKVALLFTDVSERKKAELALQQSENNLRNMIVQAPVAMSILRGESFVIEIVNEKMCELWGRSCEQLLNKSIFECLPEIEEHGYQEKLRQVYHTGETYSTYGLPVAVDRNGTSQSMFINLMYEPFRAGDGTITGVMAIATDVTEQVKSTLKEEENFKELRFAMNVMPQMVWVTYPNGDHYFYNQQWYDYTGLTYEESVNAGWNSILHPDDKERAWKVWRRSLETGEPYEIEYRFKRYDGIYRWYLGRAMPLRDEAGTIVKWFGTCTDIEDQKRAAQLMEDTVNNRTAELNMSIKELQRSNSNLEDFAYAASHDLKEPIRKIRTFSDRLKMRLGSKLSDEDLVYFNKMDNASERMQNLIDDLLNYSHVAFDSTGMENIDLNKKVKLVLEDLELKIDDKKANVVVGNLPVIKGHRRQILQLLQNLLSNALKFSREGVPPVITIKANLVKREVSGNLSAPIHHNYYLLEVGDNGIGFEQQYANLVFKMFQRLHGMKEYEGTGIGLAIVRKVVENHNGFIEVDSKPGEGTNFKIYLPVH